MKLNYKNTRKGQRGFTIVELLIVIVVIGILAGITIVAYSGVTAKANTAKAQTNANAAQSVANAINTDTGYYPGLTTDFTTAYTNPTTTLPTGITIVPDAATSPLIALSSTAKKSTITWAYVGATAATATGGKITYWDFSANAVSTTVVYVGSAIPTSTFTNPAS